ncbi:hypothetical protein SAMN05216303_106152 [Rhodoferax sp. OV413]|nr:hypothetical protein SAMN05216303_106152 [Rhodoferax sp. OV413]
MLLAWGLYIFDSARLLSGNEAIMRSCGQGWQAVFGSNRWKIRGKEPYIPNPLTPYVQMYVLQWDFVRVGGQEQGDGALKKRPEFSSFTPFVILSALCLFVLLPIGLYTRAGVWAALPAVMTMYLSNVAALVTLARRRRVLGLTPSQYWGLVVECLTCPPFAINLIRRLCALQPVKEDFVAASARVLPEEALTEVNTQCRLRLDEQIDYADDAGSRMQTLVAARARFAAEEAPS